MNHCLNQVFCFTVLSIPSLNLSSNRKENNNIFVDDLKEEVKRAIPNPVYTFEEAFADYPGIMENIIRVGFQKPTPIQVRYD